jgi:hypothetical protein
MSTIVLSSPSVIPGTQNRLPLVAAGIQVHSFNQDCAMGSLKPTYKQATRWQRPTLVNHHN